MTAPNSSIKKSIQFITDKKGENIAIQFSLKNKKVQNLIEDLLDTLTSIDRYKEKRTSFENVRKEILG